MERCGYFYLWFSVVLTYLKLFEIKYFICFIDLEFCEILTSKLFIRVYIKQNLVSKKIFFQGLHTSFLHYLETLNKYVVKVLNAVLI